MTGRPSPSPSRRSLLRSSLAVVGGLAATGCAPALTSGGSGIPVRYWNLFAGGDGGIMEEMVAAFRRSAPEIDVVGVTLEWGTPYYTKLAMAAAGGRAPEVGILHLSRLPGFAPGRLLDPFDEDLLAESGVNAADLPPDLLGRARARGRLYAIPLDTHPFVLYYNTEICEKAGLLGDDGRIRRLTGEDGVLNALREVKRVSGGLAVSCSTQDVTPWRLFWTFYRQQGGAMDLPVGGRARVDEGRAITALRFMRGLAAEGLASPNIDNIAAPAVFAGGKAGFHWNGEWEVNTFKKAGTPFGMAPFPTVYASPGAAADSHAFVLPHQRRRDPARDRAAYRFIAAMLKGSAAWAKAGHIPAYRPVAESREYLALRPQSDYRDAAGQILLDPPAWFTGSASDLQTEAGVIFQGVMSGASPPERALADFTAAANRLLATPSPV